MDDITFDRQHIWHPFTQELTSSIPISVVKTEGAYIFDQQGKKYLDMISSWWTNIHGYNHPSIIQALIDQSQRMPHVMFAGITHPPAIQLCKRLLPHLPNLLQRFFFSDNGATAVEIALKMAIQYWYNKGEKNRHKVLCFEGSYHGDTLGAMSVSYAFKTRRPPFQPFFFSSVPIFYPATWMHDSYVEERESKSFNALSHILKQEHSQMAAMIIEPLIQGASGMRMVRPTFLKKICQLLRDYHIPIIFDEVMTGFYHTGKFFALDYLGKDFYPDILCLSKGLSGGVLPLALTITTNSIYEAFLSKDLDKAFLHGHTFTGNPLACATGLASLRLLEDSNLKDTLHHLSLIHKEYMELLYEKFSFIQHPRVLGSIAAFDIQDSKLIDLLKHQLEVKGILLRPLGNTVYFVPPYCLTSQELIYVYEQIIAIMKGLTF